jgi:hypothetical protein
MWTSFINSGSLSLQPIYQKITISLEIYKLIINEQILMGFAVPTPVRCHLIGDGAPDALSMGNKTGSSVISCQIAMGSRHFDM